MRHNPKHAVDDPAIVRRLIAENPWGTLVSHADGLVASHYPILLDEDRDELAIVTHVGRPDDEIHQFGSGSEILLIVAGPHGYISPSWYAEGATPAPTWNFSVAHCYGVPQVLEAGENLRVLTRLVAHFEQHVDDPVWLDQEIGARIARGTVGIRLPITRFVCKVKMSQDKEPSPTMRAQRSTPAVDAVAEALPFDDGSFDAAMATIAIHQWPDLERGLRELRRVARGPVVILTFDGDAMTRFWLHEYVPEVFAAERARDPGIDRVARALGGEVTVIEVPIPIDCVDGFVEAFYARPAALLDPAVRRSQSAWAFVEPSVVEAGLSRLRDALASGEWDERHGHLRTRPEYLGALRLVVSRR